MVVLTSLWPRSSCMVRDSSTCQRPFWPVNSFFQRFFCGKSYCHLSSLLPEGYFESRALGRLSAPNPSGEFFWLPQSVFSGFTWSTICVWFRTLFLESFFELRYRLCFFILQRKLYFFLTRKTVFSKKTALSCIFFRISIDNLEPYMCYTIILIYSYSL